MQSNVPSRGALLDQLRRANQIAWVWVGFQLLTVAGIGFLIDWTVVLKQPMLTTLAIGMMIGSEAMPLARLWAQQKREIGDLKEDTRYGAFDKHNLRTLYRETVRKLGLPDRRIPIYITPDKSLNASAVRLGLPSLFKSFNGIYLNRQVLHRLEPEEVQDIMGHELGHFYRHYLVSSRFTMLTFVVGAMLGILLAQWTGMTNLFGIIISCALGAGFWNVSRKLWARYGRTIEYLCDDFGAQVAGVPTSINGLLKLGADGEMQMEVQYRAILSQKDGRLSAREVVEAVEKAIPYGGTSRESLEKAVEREMALRQSKESRLSVVGFLDYAWNNDTHEAVDEQLHEQAKAMQLLQSVPRLNWESLLANPAEVHFREHELPRLIEVIEANPDQALFRLPQELGAVADVHPPLRDRILYLWHNRDAIEREAREVSAYSRAYQR